MFNPAEFIEIAARLCAPNGSEAALRTSISRSYYASFLMARETLTRQGHYRHSATGADHAGVLRTLTDLQLWDMMNELNRLRHMRTIADYELESTVDFKVAQAAVRLARGLQSGIPLIK